ncbi:MAG: DapH/DapD/GlmU-related protein [Planctomycetaceae bacterium]
MHNLALHQETYEANPNENEQHIAPSAKVHPSCILEGPITIEEDVEVGPLCFLRGPLTIGAGTIIRDSCSIGSDGLFTKPVSGRYEQIRHYGGVQVGKNCQIYSGSRIAKSAIFQSVTLLEDEVSVGEQCVIGHDSHIATRTTIAAAASILGRVSVEPDCWIGAGSLISNSCRIGHNSSVKAGAVVIQDLEPDSIVSGNFAQPHHRTLRDLLK